MDDTNALRRKLDQQVDQLPEEQLREVLDFVGFLLSKTESPATAEQPNGREPGQDPLLDLIGQVETAPFAHTIDEELYGA